MELFGYFASVCIGIILGLLGGGGSILSIPLLVYFFHLDIVTATVYSSMLVGITSPAVASPKYRVVRVNLQTGVVCGITSITAIVFPLKWIVPAIPDGIIL